jgi:hypothetical protein
MAQVRGKTSVNQRGWVDARQQLRPQREDAEGRLPMGLGDQRAGCPRAGRGHQVKWNGEEWWIKTTSLLEAMRRVRVPRAARTTLNDLSRFMEACTPVGGTARMACSSNARRSSPDPLRGGTSNQSRLDEGSALGEAALSLPPAAGAPPQASASASARKKADANGIAHPSHRCAARSQDMRSV